MAAKTPNGSGGAAQETKQTSAQWPTVASVGEWTGASVENYIELSGEYSNDLPRLFIANYEFDADDEHVVDTGGTTIGPLVRRGVDKLSVCRYFGSPMGVFGLPSNIRGDNLERNGYYLGLFRLIHTSTFRVVGRGKFTRAPIWSISANEDVGLCASTCAIEISERKYQRAGRYISALIYYRLGGDIYRQY